MKADVARGCLASTLSASDSRRSIGMQATVRIGLSDFRKHGLMFKVAWLVEERRASVGLSRAAFAAGYRPASAPMTNPAAGAAISAYVGTTNGWFFACE